MDELVRDGVRLCFVDVGKGAPPILLVHDLARDHASLAAELERFKQGHRAVAADLRGHGASDSPAQAYTIAGFADDLTWLAYALGLYRPVVVGYGLGGAVALELAARVPDLPGAVVAVGTPIRWLVPMPAEMRSQRSPSDEGSSPVGEPGSVLFPPPAPAAPQGRRLRPSTDFGPADEPPPATPAATSRQVLASVTEHLGAWDGAAALAACAVPVLFIEAGGALPATPEELARLRDLCPRLAVVRAGQAAGPRELAEQVTAAIDGFVTRPTAHPSW